MLFSRTGKIKFREFFKYFQGHYLFSSIFKGLEFLKAKLKYFHGFFKGCKNPVTHKYSIHVCFVKLFATATTCQFNQQLNVFGF